jgi:hypothetical protein
MWRTLLLIALIAIAGCSNAVPEPEPTINPDDVKKRAADREKVINQGSQAK